MGSEISCVPPSIIIVVLFARKKSTKSLTAEYESVGVLVGLIFPASIILTFMGRLDRLYKYARIKSGDFDDPVFAEFRFSGTPIIIISPCLTIGNAFPWLKGMIFTSVDEPLQTPPLIGRASVGSR